MAAGERQAKALTMNRGDINPRWVTDGSMFMLPKGS
jgi:hypothetical protein